MKAFVITLLFAVPLASHAFLSHLWSTGAGGTTTPTMRTGFIMQPYVHITMSGNTCVVQSGDGMHPGEGWVNLDAVGNAPSVGWTACRLGSIYRTDNSIALGCAVGSYAAQCVNDRTSGCSVGAGNTPVVECN